jgi:hypothetical protein
MELVILRGVSDEKLKTKKKKGTIWKLYSRPEYIFLPVRRHKA